MTRPNVTAALIALGVLATAYIHVEPAEARHGRLSIERVYRWWDTNRPVGWSSLVRSEHGITAVFQSLDLEPGHAITLWFIIFNNPSECSTSPCSLPADIFNDAAEADFYFASGHVIGERGKEKFVARLPVGDVSHSGKVEVGADPVPLTNPSDAEVLLALHSHGPAMTGADLKSQVSSFLGGCEVFNGPDGFAAGEEDIPDELGECSTFQRSLHTGR